MVVAATVFAFAFVVAAAREDDADVDTDARLVSATSPPTYARRFGGPPRAGRSNGSRIRQWHLRRRHLPDCRSALPADGCDSSTPVYGCGWWCCRRSSCLVSPGGPACRAVAPVAAVRIKVSL